MGISSASQGNTCTTTTAGVVGAGPKVSGPTLPLTLEGKEPFESTLALAKAAVSQLKRPRCCNVETKIAA